MARQAQQQQQQEAARLSLSQIDPAVLRELPLEVRQEVLQHLQQQQQPGIAGGGVGRHRQHQRSRLGQRRDEEQAWRQRWHEEQALREAEEAAAAGSMPPGREAGKETSGRSQDEWLRQNIEQEVEAPAVPLVVELFLEEAEQAGSVHSLAAALADCLQSLEAQLVPKGAALPLARQRGQLASNQSADRGGGGAAVCPSSGGHDSSLAEGPGGSKDSAAGSDSGASRHSLELDLPSTQPAGRAGAGQQPGGTSPAAACSPRQDSMQRIHERQQGGVAAANADAAPMPAASPAVASPTNASGSGNSGAASSQLQHALKQLGRCLQQAAAELLAARDLEQLRQLLRAVLRLGVQHPWFAAGGGEALVAAAQRGVQARYGWPLRLPGLLDAGEAGGCA